jgi:nucleoside-diphosphate-sugar epimerase
VILITGARGFVGKALVHRLKHGDKQIRVAVRDGQYSFDGCSVSIIPDIGPNTNWRETLDGVTSIIHLAARVHIMQDPAINPLEAYRWTNCEGTRKLAESAASAGVRRLIFVSSVKAMTGKESLDFPLRETDTPCPNDPYGISKLEGEEALIRVCEKTGMEGVILRPPLVYGPGVRGNFFSLMQLIQRGFPLPLKGIHNRRSLIGLNNLVEALIRCLETPGIGGEVFLLHDGEPLSTPGLAQSIAQALNRPARLFSLPTLFHDAVRHLPGVRERWLRLTGSLYVDDQKICQRLGWRPVQGFSDALAETAAWFQQTKSKI